MHDYVTREVTDSHIAKAISMRESRDLLYGNIYSEKETDLRWVGDLGEIIVNELLCMCSENYTVWHTDNVIGKPDFTFFDVDIDVKTVKRKVSVNPAYGAQISAKHKNMKAEYIVFGCYELNKRLFHVLCAIRKNDFMRDAIYYGSGDVVHSNYTIRQGHEIYSMSISAMIPFREFIRDIMYKNKKKVV